MQMERLSNSTGADPDPQIQVQDAQRQVQDAGPKEQNIYKQIVQRYNKINSVLAVKRGKPVRQERKEAVKRKRKTEERTKNKERGDL